ncbi:MAG TPA: 30S ribosome-binding factor RbfA [Chloroflexia bacterium]|nr:30S ribosome-binding factor RbfA [Chloroflexia bacterium]
MSRRTEQVGEAIKEAVSELIQRELKDPRLGFVTVTRVEVSPDLKYAKVFFSVLGDQEAKTESLKVLKRASGYLRHELSRLLTIRYTPELHFEFDVAMEHGDKIQRLLMQLEQEEKEREALAHSEGENPSSKDEPHKEETQQ